MQHPTCTLTLVIRTIGAERGRAARGAPAGSMPVNRPTASPQVERYPI
jgi:hypothetical protein